MGFSDHDYTHRNGKRSQYYSTMPIYSIIAPEVRVMNGGHEHAHAVMGSSKPPTGVS